MSEWKIEYDNDTGSDDGGFWPRWTVTDGVKVFRCDSFESARWLFTVLQRIPE
jgi:hypothetical protein